MRFSNFKEFKESLGVDFNKVVTFLKEDFSAMMRELRIGLTKLSMEDNFESFTVEVTIAASTESAIRNRFRDGTIPSKRIIVRSTGSGLVDGDTEWSKDFVYLKNSGAASLTATVIFLK